MDTANLTLAVVNLIFLIVNLALLSFGNLQFRNCMIMLSKAADIAESILNKYEEIEDSLKMTKSEK